MWASVTFAAISLGGVAFMLRFLLALRRESRESTCEATISVRPRLHSESSEPLGQPPSGEHAGNFEDDDSYAELLESDTHAKQSSGLITLTIRPKIGSMDWRPKSPGRIGTPPHRRFVS
jgi:hypothetical protein